MEAELSTNDYDFPLKHESRRSMLKDPLSSSRNIPKPKVRIESPPREEKYSSVLQDCCLVYTPDDDDTNIKQKRIPRNDAPYNSSYNSINQTSTASSLHSEGRGSLASTSLSVGKTASMNGSYMDIEMTPARRAKIAEFENATIQKQRNELQMMIAELKGRDRELNDMVTAHQKQLIAWERDRKRILTVEEKCARLEKDICLKNDEIRSLAGQIRVAETKDMNKSSALHSAQEEIAAVTEQQTRASMHAEELKRQIRDMTEQYSLATMEIEDLEEKNRSLTKSVMDLNSTIGQFDAREQELITILKLKDKDISESANRIQEMSAKLTKIDNQLEQSKRMESELRRTSTEWKNKYNQTWKEYDFIKRECKKSDQQNSAYKTEIKRVKQQLAEMKKEVILACEREKRKDELLDLQRSKHDRSEVELTTVRDLYEHQQRDVAVLQHNLQNTKLIVDQQQNRLMQQRKKEIEAEIGLGQHTYSSPSPVNYSRSKSPLSRSPTRTTTRSYTSRSPTRNGARSPDHIRSRSPKSSLSPSRIRSRSPGTTLTSPATRPRAKSPEYRALNGRSPDRYYSRSPTRTHSPALSTYNTSRIPKYSGVSEKGDLSYSYQKELPHLESSGYYNSKSYSSPSKYGREEDLTYKSYSAYDDKNDYSSSHWSSTKALAHSADEIINKYYPAKDNQVGSFNSESLSKYTKDFAEDESQHSTPRNNDDRKRENSKREESGHSSPRGSQTGSDVKLNQFANSTPAGSKQNGDSGSIYSSHSSTPKEVDDAASQSSANSHHSGGLGAFDAVDNTSFNRQQLELVNGENDMSNQIRDVLSPVPPFEPVLDRDDQASSHSTPRSRTSDHDILSQKTESIHSVHSSTARSENGSQKAESVHSVHSVHSSAARSDVGSLKAESVHSIHSVHSSAARSDVGSLKAESVHSIHSVHSSAPRSDSGSQKAESVHSVHSSIARSDSGSQKAESIHSVHSNADMSDAGSQKAESIHSLNSVHSKSDHGSVKMVNGTAAAGIKTNSHISADDLQDAQELDDMFSSQPSKVEIRSDSTTPTNDIPAMDLLAENNSHESPRTQFGKLLTETSEIAEDLEKSLESNPSLNASLHSANSSMKDNNGQSGGTVTESFEGVD